MEGTDVCGDILEQEADFEQTFALLELGTQELEVEVQDSFEEVWKYKTLNTPLFVVQ